MTHRRQWRPTMQQRLLLLAAARPEAARAADFPIKSAEALARRGLITLERASQPYYPGSRGFRIFNVYRATAAGRALVSPESRPA